MNAAKKGKLLFVALCILILALVGVIVRLGYEVKVAKSKVEIREVIREVKVKGPVRIKYRKVVEKSEPEIIEKVVYKVINPQTPEPSPEPVIQTADGYDRSQDRILAGVAIHGIGSKRFYQSFLAGYSFGNKLDVLGGVSPQEDTKYSFQTNYRF